MKNLILLLITTLSFVSYSQHQIDYKLARTGEYVLGVYMFIHCDPVNAYDYVGKIDKFDFYNTNDVEKEILKKFNATRKDFQKFVTEKEPIYNCPEGGEKIFRVWEGKAADLRLTELIQEFSKSMNN